VVLCCSILLGFCVLFGRARLWRIGCPLFRLCVLRGGILGFGLGRCCRVVLCCWLGLGVWVPSRCVWLFGIECPLF